MGRESHVNHQSLHQTKSLHQSLHQKSLFHQSLHQSLSIKSLPSKALRPLKGLFHQSLFDHTLRPSNVSVQLTPQDGLKEYPLSVSSSSLVTAWPPRGVPCRKIPRKITPHSETFRNTFLSACPGMFGSLTAPGFLVIRLLAPSMALLASPWLFSRLHRSSRTACATTRGSPTIGDDAVAPAELSRPRGCGDGGAKLTYRRLVIIHHNTEYSLHQSPSPTRKQTTVASRYSGESDKQPEACVV